MMRMLIVMLAAALPAFAASQPEVLEMASQERARAGLIALYPDARLLVAAHMQAEFMAQTGRATHQGPGGSSVFARIRASGYSGCYGAENVAGGQRSARQVHGDWMRSAGHRNNILDRRMTHGAVAAVRDRRGRLWWVMVLAGPC